MENHELQMENKKRISLTEVVSVEGFDEENIFVNLQGDELAIGGKNLHIETLNLEDGRLVAEGEIDSLIYSGKKRKEINPCPVSPMTFQIKSELLELLIMFYCGMAIMLTFELRDRLIKRASAYRRLSYVIYLGSWVCGGFLFCQFLYRGSHGVVTLYGILSMIAGILLWKKIFYGIMKP